ncbi:MAG TPA: N-acetylmuramoyl-L-alanine amidase [Terriglobales bacterium]|nr:N-acetylmuramoyl-L-alanine amidase [Terriglobales bacterium]
MSSTTNTTLATLLAIVTLLSAAPSALLSALPSALLSADEKHLSVYSPVAIYTLPVLDRAGREYIGLLELLEPLGRVRAESEGRRWRLRYNAVDAEFIAGKTRARIGGRDFDFMAPFLLENSRGLVPLSSLSGFLPRFLGTPVNFRESARRLFVGDVGVQISFELDTGNPPRLALNFTAPVNPTISTEPGKLRMVFKRDPVISPGSQSISFDNKVITHAAYSENNGNAELEVAANEPLIASFTNSRRTIVVSAVPQGTPSNGAPGVVAPGPQTPPQSPTQTPPPEPPVVHRVLAVVDPAHGGEERGAALTDKLAEKDVTLGFARLLRHELDLRGFAVILLRDGDITSGLDQRAAAANTARAGIYISLHAVAQGSGARVYTALLPVEGTSKGVFHAWNAAQEPSLPISRIVSAAIVNEMQKREFPVRASSASLRPLNNVFMPAVAVELAPGPDGLADLTSANYQQRAASAIANAVLSVRDRLGVQQ